MDFEDRTVVVTGGAGALGRAVVELLLARGARCTVPVRGDGAGVRGLRSDRLTMVPGCDVTVEADVERLYAGVGALWASIHVAGGFAMAPVGDTDKAALMRMLETNLVSCHLCSRAALAAFGAAGGRIVNVAARTAVEPGRGAGMTAYVASKAGVAAITQALAAEVVGRGVLVNAVSPAIIDTPANRAAMPGARTDAWASPAEIAETILFLASPRNRVTAGAVVPVYGRLGA